MTSTSPELLRELLIQIENINNVDRISHPVIWNEIADLLSQQTVYNARFEPGPMFNFVIASITYILEQHPDDGIETLSAIHRVIQLVFSAKYDGVFTPSWIRIVDFLQRLYQLVIDKFPFFLRFNFAAFPLLLIIQNVIAACEIMLTSMDITQRILETILHRLLPLHIHLQGLMTAYYHLVSIQPDRSGVTTQQHPRHTPTITVDDIHSLSLPTYTGEVSLVAAQQHLQTALQPHQLSPYLVDYVAHLAHLGLADGDRDGHEDGGHHGTPFPPFIAFRPLFMHALLVLQATFDQLLTSHVLDRHADQLSRELLILFAHIITGRQSNSPSQEYEALPAITGLKPFELISSMNTVHRLVKNISKWASFHGQDYTSKPAGCHYYETNVADILVSMIKLCTHVDDDMTLTQRSMYYTQQMQVFTEFQDKQSKQALEQQQQQQQQQQEKRQDKPGKHGNTPFKLNTTLIHRYKTLQLDTAVTASTPVELAWGYLPHYLELTINAIRKHYTQRLKDAIASINISNNTGGSNEASYGASYQAQVVAESKRVDDEKFHIESTLTMLPLSILLNSDHKPSTGGGKAPQATDKSSKSKSTKREKDRSKDLPPSTPTHTGSFYAFSSFQSLYGLLVLVQRKEVFSSSADRNLILFGLLQYLAINLLYAYSSSAASLHASQYNAYSIGYYALNMFMSEKYIQPYLRSRAAGMDDDDTGMDDSGGGDLLSSPLSLQLFAEVFKIREKDFDKFHFHDSLQLRSDHFPTIAVIRQFLESTASAVAQCSVGDVDHDDGKHGDQDGDSNNSFPCQSVLGHLPAPVLLLQLSHLLPQLIIQFIDIGTDAFTNNLSPIFIVLNSIKSFVDQYTLTLSSSSPLARSPRVPPSPASSCHVDYTPFLLSHVKTSLDQAVSLITQRYCMLRSPFSLFDAYTNAISFQRLVYSALVLKQREMLPIKVRKESLAFPPSSVALIFSSHQVSEFPTGTTIQLWRTATNTILQLKHMLYHCIEECYKTAIPEQSTGKHHQQEVSAASNPFIITDLHRFSQQPWSAGSNTNTGNEKEPHAPLPASAFTGCKSVIKKFLLIMASGLQQASLRSSTELLQHISTMTPIQHGTAQQWSHIVAKSENAIKIIVAVYSCFISIHHSIFTPPTALPPEKRSSSSSKKTKGKVVITGQSGYSLPMAPSTYQWFVQCYRNPMLISTPTTSSIVAPFSQTASSPSPSHLSFNETFYLAILTQLSGSLLRLRNRAYESLYSSIHASTPQSTLHYLLPPSSHLDASTSTPRSPDTSPSTPPLPPLFAFISNYTTYLHDTLLALEQSLKPGHRQSAGSITNLDERYSLSYQYSILLETFTHRLSTQSFCENASGCTAEDMQQAILSTPASSPSSSTLPCPCGHATHIHNFLSLIQQLIERVKALGKLTIAQDTDTASPQFASIATTTQSFFPTLTAILVSFLGGLQVLSKAIHAADHCIDAASPQTIALRQVIDSQLVSIFAECLFHPIHIVSTHYASPTTQISFVVFEQLLSSRWFIALLPRVIISTLKRCLLSAFPHVDAVPHGNAASHEDVSMSEHEQPRKRARSSKQHTDASSPHTVSLSSHPDPITALVTLLNSWDSLTQPHPTSTPPAPSSSSTTSSSSSSSSFSSSPPSSQGQLLENILALIASLTQSPPPHLPEMDVVYSQFCSVLQHLNNTPMAFISAIFFPSSRHATRPASHPYLYICLFYVFELLCANPHQGGSDRSPPASIGKLCLQSLMGKINASSLSTTSPRSTSTSPSTSKSIMTAYSHVFLSLFKLNAAGSSSSGTPDTTALQQFITVSLLCGGDEMRDQLLTHSFASILSPLRVLITTKSNTTSTAEKPSRSEKCKDALKTLSKLIDAIHASSTASSSLSSLLHKYIRSKAQHPALVLLVLESARQGYANAATTSSSAIHALTTCLSTLPSPSGLADGEDPIDKKLRALLIALFDLIDTRLTESSRRITSQDAPGVDDILDYCTMYKSAMNMLSMPILHPALFDKQAPSGSTLEEIFVEPLYAARLSSKLTKAIQRAEDALVSPCLLIILKTLLSPSAAPLHDASHSTCVSLALSTIEHAHTITSPLSGYPILLTTREAPPKAYLANPDYIFYLSLPHSLRVVVFYTILLAVNSVTAQSLHLQSLLSASIELFLERSLTQSTLNVVAVPSETGTPAIVSVVGQNLAIQQLLSFTNTLSSFDLSTIGERLTSLAQVASLLPHPDHGGPGGGIFDALSSCDATTKAASHVDSHHNLSLSVSHALVLVISKLQTMVRAGEALSRGVRHTVILSQSPSDGISANGGDSDSDSDSDPLSAIARINERNKARSAANTSHPASLSLKDHVIAALHTQTASIQHDKAFNTVLSSTTPTLNLFHSTTRRIIHASLSQQTAMHQYLTYHIHSPRSSSAHDETDQFLFELLSHSIESSSPLKEIFTPATNGPQHAIANYNSADERVPALQSFSFTFFTCISTLRRVLSTIQTLLRCSSAMHNHDLTVCVDVVDCIGDIFAAFDASYGRNVPTTSLTNAFPALAPQNMLVFSLFLPYCAVLQYFPPHFITRTHGSHITYPVWIKPITFLFSFMHAFTTFTSSHHRVYQDQWLLPSGSPVTASGSHGVDNPIPAPTSLSVSTRRLSSSHSSFYTHREKILSNLSQFVHHYTKAFITLSYYSHRQSSTPLILPIFNHYLHLYSRYSLQAVYVTLKPLSLALAIVGSTIIEDPQTARERDRAGRPLHHNPVELRLIIGNHDDIGKSALQQIEDTIYKFQHYR